MRPALVAVADVCLPPWAARAILRCSAVLSQQGFRAARDERLFGFITSNAERLYERNNEQKRECSRQADRNLLRAAELVCAAVSANGRTRRQLAQAGRALPPIRCGFARGRVLAAVQSHEPFGLAARRGTWNLLHHKLFEALGRQRRARGKRIACVHARDVKGAATWAAREARTSVSESARDQSSVASG